LPLREATAEPIVKTPQMVLKPILRKFVGFAMERKCDRFWE